MKKKILITALAVATSSLGATISPIALAEGLTLEEIVVTARKRKEDLQDVGLSVSAMSGTEIQRTFARDIKDLAFLSPNLIIDDTSQGPGGNAAIYIRGIGVADVEKNFEPAVGVTIDGLFIGANSGAILRSIDLASLEVLRGPQGTLFGRNTIGGTINVERSRPTGEFGGKVRAGYGDYDTYWLDAVVNFGITDDLAVKLSAAKNDQQDGYFENVNTGNDDGAVDYQSVGLNLLWNASETLELEYTYQNEETDQDTPPLVNMAQPDTLFCASFGLCAQSVSTPSSGDRYKVTTLNFEPTTASLSPAPTQIVTSAIADLIPNNDDATFDAETHILEARWDISDSLTMNYIYGSFETEETVVTNFASEPLMLFGTDRPAEYEQESHELRFTYDAGGALKFTAGAYFWESEYDIRLRSWITFAVPDTVLDIPQTTHQETDSTAIFFEGDYALNDSWTLTLGGRYTEDEKLSEQRGNLTTAANDPSEKWDEFTPKVGLRYRINDDAMVYATYAKGYRSGGFNGRVDELLSATVPYDPETVDNYELGFKSEWSDGRVRLNGAIFYMDYQDKQEEIGLPSTGATGQRISVFNAANATMQGAELEVRAIITEGLTVNANLGYLDSEYDDFSFNNGFGIVDNSGFEFRRAPEFTGAVNATYEWQVGDGEAWVRGSYRFLGEHFIEQTNRAELENDDQHLVDLSVNYTTNGLTFSVFGRNLTAEDGWAHGLNVSGLWAYASARAPRTWGAEVTYNFGAQ
ncbi:MAG: iron complex outermembrane receptor protein [Halioglobus sp.]|jgi:iron complex outermembrane receptor protein